MSQSPRPQYEFSQEQNATFGSLATSMRGVGFFFILIGVLNILAAIFVIVAIYRAKLPKEYVDTVMEQVSEGARTDVSARLEKLPADNHLWGAAIASAVNGLLYFLIGMWTSSASGQFRKVVDTQGSDVTHLMSALSSLNKMYGLIYMIIVLALLLFIAAVGLFIYSQLAR